MSIKNIMASVQRLHGDERAQVVKHGLYLAWRIAQGTPSMNTTEESERWLWPRYNPPGLLIGPLPHLRTASGGWVADYSHPGVAERVRIAVDFIIEQDRRA